MKKEEARGLGFTEWEYKVNTACIKAMSALKSIACPDGVPFSDEIYECYKVLGKLDDAVRESRNSRNRKQRADGIK